jgi:hypothetical protein
MIMRDATVPWTHEGGVEESVPDILRGERNVKEQVLYKGEDECQLLQEAGMVIKHFMFYR